MPNPPRSCSSCSRGAGGFSHRPRNTTLLGQVKISHYKHVSLPISIMSGLFVPCGRTLLQKMLIQDTIARRFKASSSRCGACARRKSLYFFVTSRRERHFFSSSRTLHSRCRVKIDRSLSSPYIRRSNASHN